MNSVIPKNEWRTPRLHPLASSRGLARIKQTTLALTSVACLSITAFAARPAAVGGGYVDAGLVGDYYANSSFSGSPQFSRRDVRLDFDPATEISWAGSRAYPLAGYPTDDFSIRWTGQLRARFAEPYTFRAVADDAVVVKLKKATDPTYTTVVNQSTYIPSGTIGTLSMEADLLYDIVVEYREFSGSARLQLFWSSPSTREEIIDVATEVSINWYSYVEDTFADAVKNGRNHWEPYFDGDASEDANGWPLSNCAFNISEAIDPPAGVSPLETGNMPGSFTGRATLSAWGNCEIVAGSVQYDSLTNRTTFLLRGGFTRDDKSMISLRFDDTDRDGDYGPDGLPDEDGFTDLKVMRIDPETQVPYPEGQIFNNAFLAAFDRLTAIRHQRTNDQAINWEDRTQPDDALYQDSVRPYVYNDRYKNGEWNLKGRSLMAHEYEIMMSNQLGADYYVTVPHLATAEGTDSYIGKLARLIKYGSDATGEPYSAPTANPHFPPLNPNLRVYIEISNELWNFGALKTYAPYHDYKHLMEDMIDANDPVFNILNFDNLPLTMDGAYHVHNYTWVMRYWAYKLMVISNTFRNVFGDAEMPGNDHRDPRIRPFYTWQYGNSNGTASTGLKFMSNYFNNEAGNFVAIPRPPSYYFWSGGGAGYYSVDNKDGFVSPNPIPNQSFESTPLAAPVTNPTNASWSFNAQSGLAPNPVLSTAVTGQSVAAIRNDLSGYAGHRFTVGASDIVVYELGRYIHAGNVNEHTIHVLRASDGVQITATQKVTASASLAGTFQYSRCVPIILEANTSYYLISSETAGLDSLGTATSTVTTDGTYVVDHPATATLADKVFTVSDETGSGLTYGPLSLRYAPVWEVAPGVPLNNPFTMADEPGTVENAGTQAAWLWSSEGSQAEVSTTFTLPSEQISDVYALSFRWCGRTAFSTEAPDQPRLSITATIGGIDYDITPLAPETRPRPWSPEIEWHLKGYWEGNYYGCEIFHANAGAVVTVTFRTTNETGDHIAFLDDIKLTSNDAFYDSAELGAGTAAGQTSARYPTNQYNDGKWCAAYGLMQMTYEHGFSAGGDAGNSPLQDYAKFFAPEARQTAIDCLDVFQQAGGRLPTFGTYNIWPTFQNTAIAGVKVFGTGHPEDYPLVQGVDDIMRQLPEVPQNGVEVPNVISGTDYTLTMDGDLFGNLQAGEWYTYNFVVGNPGDYRLTLQTNGSGQFELLLDGAIAWGTSTAGTPFTTSDRYLDYGLHAVRVRSISGDVTVDSLLISRVGAPEAPVITSHSDNVSGMTVTWSSVPGSVGYRVYWGTASRIYTSSQDVGAANSYTITGLEDNTQYFVSVRAYNSVGNSLPSAEVTRIDFSVPQPLLVQNFDTTPSGQVPDGWTNEATNNVASVATVIGTGGSNAYKGTNLTLRTLALYDLTQIEQVDFRFDFFFQPTTTNTTSGLIGAGFSDAESVTNPFNAGGTKRTLMGIALDGAGGFRLAKGGQFNQFQMFGNSFSLTPAVWYRIEASVVYDSSTGAYLFSGIQLLALGADGTDSPQAITLSQTSVSAPVGSALDVTRAKFIVAGNEGRGGGLIDNVQVSAVGIPPSITAQPASQAAKEGGNASLSVTAAGSGLTYQWQSTAVGGSSWSDITGATSSALIITNVIPSDEKDYRVVVTDDQLNSLTSDTATLTVDFVPRITTTSLPNAQQGQAYSTTLAAASGTGTLSWSIISGSLPSGLSLSSGGVISGTSNSAGTANFTASTVDINGDSDQQTLSITTDPASPPPSGDGLDRDYWTGITGNNISNLTGDADFPNNPDGMDIIVDGFASIGWSGSSNPGGTSNWANNYGERLYGYLVPETTGNYTFWASGDDDVDLYLSTDSDPANATRIAYVDGWTDFQQWGKFTSQKSAAINLTAGQVYYIEVLHKEGGSGDHCAVGWAKPGQATTAPSEVVPGHVLYPYSGGVPVTQTWTGQDIGAVSAAGSSNYDDATGTFTVEGSGADIWGLADEFHFMTLDGGLSGDGAIQARVVSMVKTHGWAKAGVMIRDGLAANAMYAMTVVTPNNGVSFQRRTAVGGGSANTSQTGVSAPWWVRIERVANTFTSKSSVDGLNWTTVGSVTITMGTDVEVGLCVTSHADGTLCTAVLDNVTVE